MECSLATPRSPRMPRTPNDLAPETAPTSPLGSLADPSSPAIPPDFYNLFAQQQGAPVSWQWYEIRRTGTPAQQLVLIRGAVCTATINRSQYKGQIDWKKLDGSTLREYVATTNQIDAVRDGWEHQTGRCATCGGDGRECCGWSTADGRQYRTCRRCGGSGRAAQRIASSVARSADPHSDAAPGGVPIHGAPNPRIAP